MTAMGGQERPPRPARELSVVPDSPTCGSACARPAGSDLFEAAAGCGKTVRDLQRVDGAVQLQRADAFAVRDQTTGDIDFARRAARFEAEGNGRKLHNDAFDQGVAGAAKGFDA